MIPIAIAAALLLAGAGGTMMYLRAAATHPEFHRVTFRRRWISSARFAPDGRTILYGSGVERTSNRGVLDARRGAVSVALPLSSSDILSISKRGQLALNLGRHSTEWFVTNGTLAEAPRAGGVAPRERQTNVQEADWLPDGETMAVLRNASGQTILEFPAGQARYTTSGWISHVRVA